MKQFWKTAFEYAKIVAGCAIFALGFDLFLEPHGLNAGGISGLSMVFVHWFQIGTVGLISVLINLPLFALGGFKIGKTFFIHSLIGMLLLSLFIDLFVLIPTPQTEPLIGALYGGLLCGFGIGLVFSANGSTGGSDIIVRLLKLRYQAVPIGVITMSFDMMVAFLTGISFQNLDMTLYSLVAIFISGRVIDAVVYSFDYSKVAIIISKHYGPIAKAIGSRLHRGATFLNGEGVYSGTETKVILTAVKKQQITELKELVVETDPSAFIIVQDAHQVLGDGFARYSKFNL